MHITDISINPFNFFMQALVNWLAPILFYQNKRINSFHAWFMICRHKMANRVYDSNYDISRIMDSINKAILSEIKFKIDFYDLCLNKNKSYFLNRLHCKEIFFSDTCNKFGKNKYKLLLVRLKKRAIVRVGYFHPKKTFGLY